MPSLHDWAAACHRTGARGLLVWEAGEPPLATLPQAGGEVLHWSPQEGPFQPLLGRSASMVVLDVTDGVVPNAAAALAGVVQAGGLLVWCAAAGGFSAPVDLSDYGRLLSEGCDTSRLAYRFEQRLGRHLQAQAVCYWQRADGTAVVRWPAASRLAVVSPARAQQQAIDAIVALPQADAPMPVMLVADRGRGKSAALGLAAARCLQRDALDIVVTAPARDNVERVFAHAAAELGVAPTGSSLVGPHGGALRFVPLDVLLGETTPALVLVDEASGFALSLLQAARDLFPRLALATTVHGYEGSGRGFVLRLRADWRLRGLTELELTEPQRWHAGDPLERWCDEALLLTAEPALLDGPTDAPWYIEAVTAAELARDDALLRQVFGLLVMAHYRTSPEDLRWLLDAPDVHLLVARRVGQIIGVAVTVDEGGLSASLTADVIASRRRPAGHLAAQTMAFHLGVGDALRVRSRRVARIVVHPDARRQGVARGLIEAAGAQVQQDGGAFLSASFSAAEELFPFWRACGFQLLRLGGRCEKTSGLRPLLAAWPLNAAGQRLLFEAAKVFGWQWRWARQTALGHVGSGLQAWLATLPEASIEVDAARAFCQRFARGQCPFEAAAFALRWWVQTHGDGGSEDGRVLRLATDPPQTLTDVAAALGVSGKRAAARAIRDAMASRLARSC